MSNSATALRRWWSAFSLAVAFAMLIWGQTVLKPHLQGNLFLVYWLLFLAFTCSTVGISLLDFFAVRRSLKGDIAALKAKALAGIDRPGTPQKKVSPPMKMLFSKRQGSRTPARNKGRISPKTTRH